MRRAEKPAFVFRHRIEADDSATIAPTIILKRVHLIICDSVVNKQEREQEPEISVVRIMNDSYTLANSDMSPSVQEEVVHATWKVYHSAGNGIIART